ncbi:MAG: fused DSP-PTPase phosphatase/NAD kinase-like protein [Candidatus Binatia bacterium]
MKIFFIGALVASLAASAPVENPPRRSERLPPGQLNLKTIVNVPVVLCIDDKPTVGGQPSGEAYAKAAANGFRSVITLRSPKDGVDTLRERFLVENNRMRYFNIPTVSAIPTTKQVDEFLQTARDPTNHPMLINCAFAERVAPYMMMFRIQEEGWTEEKALEEAIRLGRTRDEMRKLARSYLIPRTAK